MACLNNINNKVSLIMDDIGEYKQEKNNPN